MTRYEGGGDAPATAPENVDLADDLGGHRRGPDADRQPRNLVGHQPDTRVTEYWRRCDSGAFQLRCQFIGGATGTTYTLGAADVGRTIRVHETATNPSAARRGRFGRTAVVTAKPTTGAVAGTVRKRGPEPASPNASVSCGSGYSAKTSAAGAYSIANAPPGTHTCTASANGYAPKSQKVKVSSGQQTTANFSLVRR